jgi:hypothetical protein
MLRNIYLRVVEVMHSSARPEQYGNTHRNVFLWLLLSMFA